MNYSFLLESVQFADWIVNIGFQSTVILVVSLLMRRLSKNSPAPIRSNICFLTIVLLLILPLTATVSIQTKATRISTLPHPLELKRNFDESFGIADEESFRTINKESELNENAVGSKSNPWLINKSNVFGIIWLSGIAIMLIRLIHGLRTINFLKADLNPVSDKRVRSILSQVSKVVALKVPPAIYTSPLINSPQTIGVLKPCIIIPENLCKITETEELRGILLHETSHIYHLDHWSGLMQRIVTSVYWWHPLVYHLSRDFSLEREYISDNYAVNYGNPVLFAKSLLKLAKNAYQLRQLPASLGVINTRSSLEKRIKTIISDSRQTETRTRKKTFTIQVTGALFLLGMLFCINWTTASQKVLEKTATFSYLKNPHMMDIDQDYIYIAENKDLYVIDRTDFTLSKTIENIGVGDMWNYRIKDINVKSDSIYTTTKYYVRLYDKKTGKPQTTYKNWKRKLSEVVPFGDKLVKVYWEKPNTVLSLCNADLEDCKNILEINNSQCSDVTKICNFYASSWGIDNDEEQLIVALSDQFRILRFDKNGTRLKDINLDYRDRVPLTNEFIDASLERWRTKNKVGYEYLNAMGYKMEFPEYFPAISEVTISDGIIYATTFKIENGKIETYRFDSDGSFIDQRLIATKYTWENPYKGPATIREGKSFELAWENESWHLYVSEIE